MGPFGLAAVRALLVRRRLQGVMRAAHVAPGLGNLFLRNRHRIDLSCEMRRGALTAARKARVDSQIPYPAQAKCNILKALTLLRFLEARESGERTGRLAVLGSGPRARLEANPGRPGIWVDYQRELCNRKFTQIDSPSLHGLRRVIAIEGDILGLKAVIGGGAGHEPRIDLFGDGHRHRGKADNAALD